MGTLVYVGNLDRSVQADALMALFAPFGRVRQAHVMRNNETGRSQGFGFVEMVRLVEAEAAIVGLHQQRYAGRPLTVGLAMFSERQAVGPSG